MAHLRQLAWSALIGGVVAGLLLIVMQTVWTTPLIREAERYENLPPESQSTDPQATAPKATAPLKKPGVPVSRPPAAAPPAALPAEPTGYSILATTLLADLAVGLGHALLLCAGLALAGRKVNAVRGLVWGACGYAAFVLAPSLWLPPVPPGVAAGALASLAGRQLWWLLTVSATIAGLWTFAFARGGRKVVGVAWLLTPHLALAPLLLPPESGGGAVPPELTGGFILAVLVVNAAFWLTLGALCGGVWGRLESRG